jgi:D-serine deaminase-like pyridoxal phosphate-dependent protein
VIARRLADLPTPALVLDRSVLRRNLATMAAAVGRHPVALRPHLKTAKSIDVARLATAGQAGGITVSTLAEAEHFAAAGFRDILYAVGITPAKLDRAASLQRSGIDLILVTDDPDAAHAIARHAAAAGTKPRVLVEVDCGEHRAGAAPDSDAVIAVGQALGPLCAGVMTHAGLSYACPSVAEMAALAEHERACAVAAAERLRAIGAPVKVVSVGSTPTSRFATNLDGVTETRPGVYMFNDLFQIQLSGDAVSDIAVTVLAAVTGLRPSEQRVLIDAGGIALSKDRSTASAPIDYGFGLVLDPFGAPRFGHAIVERANQEHGVVHIPDPAALAELRVGSLVRVATNHVCMTASAYDRYHVVDGDDAVVAVWPRVSGW